MNFSFYLVFPYEGGSKDSQNVDLFSGMEKSHHRSMKRNKSADDVLSPGLLHDEDEFFSQLGSHSASSSRENVTSFMTPNDDSGTFDPFQTTRTKSPGNSSLESGEPDLFDPFSSKRPDEKSTNEFDPFVAKKVGSTHSSFDPFASSQSTSFDLFPTKQSGGKAQSFDPFGSQPGKSSSSTFGSKNNESNFDAFDILGGTSTTASEDLFGVSSSQAPTATVQGQVKSNVDLIGDWGGSSSATFLQPNRKPSPNLPKATNGSIPPSKTKPSDPFADFGNLKSGLPTSSTAPKFPSASTSPKPQKKPGPGTSANLSWSRPSQQPPWQSGARSSSPAPKAQSKPNYAPSYSMSGSSGVFGDYGQKWSGECLIIFSIITLMTIENRAL